MPYKGREKTVGGVYVPDETRDVSLLLRLLLTLLKLAHLLTKTLINLGRIVSRGAKKGDWVCIGRYAGSRFKLDGGEVRIINDDEVIATILDPEDIIF